MQIRTPAPRAAFSISADATWPKITFTTDASGPHRWDWSITWRTFTKSGTASSPGNSWDAGPAIANCGGTLSVRVSAAGGLASTSVIIRGTNPTAAAIAQYLAQQPNNEGMAKIIQQESKDCQFDARGEPLHSFDNGYGLCQLTNPPPTIEQVWNWKLHIKQGLSVLADKRRDAVKHLAGNGRSYTSAQLPI